MTLLAALLLTAAHPADAPALSPRLAPLARVAGSCWRGTFPDGGQTDTHCFTAIYGGAFVRDTHVVEGAAQPYSGETLCRWDGEQGQIVYDYYASDGSHSDGAARPAANGLVFPEEAHRSRTGAAPVLIRSSWTWDGADAYVVLAERMQGKPGKSSGKCGWSGWGRRRLDKLMQGGSR